MSGAASEVRGCFELLEDVVNVGGWLKVVINEGAVLQGCWRRVLAETAGAPDG